MHYKLFLDDERYPATLDEDWRIARNYHDAVWYVTHYGCPYYISFDHDLGTGTNDFTGMDFAKWWSYQVMDGIIAIPEEFMWYVHSQNPVGANNIRMYMTQFLKDWK